MKKLILILTLVFVSCDKETIIQEVEQPCECIKTVYKQEVIYNPSQNIVTSVAYTEKVICQDEVEKVPMFNYQGNYYYFEIKCK